MNLYNFDVEYFSAIDWKRLSFEVIAENENQVKEWVNKKCPPECRDRPYCGGTGGDTLKITQHNEIELPFIVSSNLD